MQHVCRLSKNYNMEHTTGTLHFTRTRSPSSDISFLNGSAMAGCTTADNPMIRIYINHDIESTIKEPTVKTLLTYYSLTMQFLKDARNNANSYYANLMFTFYHNATIEVIFSPD